MQLVKNPAIAGQDDAYFMRLALAQCSVSESVDEVPVGAVVVKDGQIIAVGSNSPIRDHDPTAHAEVKALRAAALHLKNYRLDGCELYVTLEPCAMCAGAMLHARIKRVVFGASDPKTGVAGSVVNLFSQTQLNHHTSVTQGVLQDECAQLLRRFFHRKRREKRDVSCRLRDDSLRTPDSRFGFLESEGFASEYLDGLASLNGWRLHYFQAQASLLKAPIYLCLHASSTWSYTFQALLQGVLKQGTGTVIAPDLIGFGMSDKPKREDAHDLRLHVKILQELVNYLDLWNIVLVLQGDALTVGLQLILQGCGRYCGLVMLDPPAWASAAACGTEHRLDLPPGVPGLPLSIENAPYPDTGHRAGPRAFASHVSAALTAPDSMFLEQAAAFFQEEWQHPTIVVARKPPRQPAAARLRKPRKPTAAPVAGIDQELAMRLFTYFAA